jgi:hypothetical protein
MVSEDLLSDVRSAKKKSRTTKKASSAATTVSVPKVRSSSSTTGSTTKLPSPRRAKVYVQKINPVSAAKIAFPVALTTGIIISVAVIAVWGFLNVSGLLVSVSDWISGAGFSANQFNLLGILGFGNILAFMMIFSVALAVSMSLLSFVMALIYNRITSLVGGLQITLGDD